MDRRKTSATASWDGMPRVSPNACIHDAVVDELFDDVWQDGVRLLEELLRKQKQHSGRSIKFKLTEISYSFAIASVINFCTVKAVVGS